MKLIAGLGNPTAAYASTRHNAGFMAADRLAMRGEWSGERSRFGALVREGRIGEERVMLMKPQTYMNRSGESVGAAVRFFKLGVEDVLVLVDDTALEAGMIRVRAEGSSGGHNGLSDVARHLGGEDFARVRIGIGEPVAQGRRIAQRDYVLGSLSEEERGVLEPALERAAEAAECWVREGVEKAMTRYNRRQRAAGSGGGEGERGVEEVGEER